MGRGWLFIAALLLVLAALLRQGSLLLVSSLLFMLYGVAQIWAKYSLRRLEYSRHLSTTRAFYGDEVTFEVSLSNRKVLPLPWVQIEEELDEQLHLPDAVATSPSHRPGRVVLKNLMPLGWYHRVKRIYPLRCTKRGYFAFGPTRIQTGDYFRFRVKEMEVEDPVYLMVYPRIVPLNRLGIRSRDPFGDLRLRRHLFQDPVRVASVREYAPGDPMKRINWKASARVGRLQTKVFEPTTSMDLAIFLDVRTVRQPFWGEVTQLLETGTIVAASVASHLVEKGYRVGLYVNHPFPDSGRLIKLPPSGQPDQLQHILEALAMVGQTESVAIDKFVRQEGGDLPWVSTLVVVTAVPTPALLDTLAGYHRMGRPVALVVIGGEGPESGPNGLPVYQVPADITWDKVETLEVNAAE
ncbi:MAG: hypothetical protein A2147_10420 [Chloroflexi bacterium RBG_16_57_8]|nr:MAG: hypothetical protein A2147_10420 [Chloroflexi bacterium RBG_16_57_8]